LPKDQIKDVCKTFRPHFKGLIIGNNGLDAENGLKKIREGSCDAVSFGKLYISNPDLAERIIRGNPLNKNVSVATFYGVLLENKAKGYTDYPFYQE
jgi:2,4-dienoyl-CoA reductase-like NADH-dependent reductase (Old Yellow Enzyme family)